MPSQGFCSQRSQHLSQQGITSCCTTLQGLGNTAANSQWTPEPPLTRAGSREWALPLLSVPSFLSDRLMARDAPSGICRGKRGCQ